MHITLQAEVRSSQRGFDQGVAVHVRVVLRWRPLIQGPSGSPLGGEVAAEALGRLVDVVSDYVDGGVPAGAAEGDVGELAAAAIVIAVSGIDGCALAAVNGRGVAVVE